MSDSPFWPCAKGVHLNGEPVCFPETMQEGEYLCFLNGELVGATPDAGPGGAVAWADITDKPATFPPEAHNQAISTITGLQAALDGKQAAGSYAAATHNHDAAYEPKNANIQAHVSAAHAPADAQKNSDITKAEIEAKLTGTISSHSHAGGSDPFIFKGSTSGDISTAANTTPVNVTGLSFSFEANAKYVVEVYGAVKAAAATTGVGLHLDVSAAVTASRGTFFHQLANTGTLTGGSSIADDASVGVSSGLPSTNTDVPFYWAGSLITGANTGTAQLRFRSEVAAVATLSAHCLMRVQKISP